MADIAILVAEEYERRIRNSKNQVGEYEKIDLVSSVSIMAKRVDVSHWINQHVGDGSSSKMEVAKWILEPKTQIGVAASDGLFSA